MKEHLLISHAQLGVHGQLKLGVLLLVSNFGILASRYECFVLGSRGFEIWGEWLFIFRELESTGNYFKGFGGQAQVLGI